MFRWLHLPLIVIVSFTFLTGCGGKHVGIKEDRPVYLSQESLDLLYRYCAEDVKAHAPQTGFYPLEHHLDSMAARLLLAKAAQHRITVQYFTFSDDLAGRMLSQALMEAADRGVQVDVLIDDMAISFDDDTIAQVNAHTNIRVRVFNPTNSRRALHYVEMGMYGDTVGRRMHNKSFTADNSMAVFGGRNIGNIYFGLDKKNYFIDNDVLAVGPLVNDISNQFDIYFSNAYSVDFEIIAKAKIDEMQALKKSFDALVHDKKYLALKQAIQERTLFKQFSEKQMPLYFGDARLTYDMPEKIATDINDSSTHIKRKVPQKIGATKRFYMVSPYFIPSEKMIERIQKMRDAGVDVAVLTNSLESSDQTPVYAYYSLSQKRLLEMGVRLYEIHPFAFEKELVNQNYNLLKHVPHVALHAKTIVIDDDLFSIGSINMDPRSRNLNTELVSIIKSRELNAYEARNFARMIAPENAYELSLEYDEDNRSKIVWKATLDGEQKIFYNHGNSGTWLRAKRTMSLWFPIHDLL